MLEVKPIGTATHHFGMTCRPLWITIGFICIPSVFTNTTVVVVVPFLLGVSIVICLPVMWTTLCALGSSMSPALSMIKIQVPLVMSLSLVAFHRLVTNLPPVWD